MTYKEDVIKRRKNTIKQLGQIGIGNGIDMPDLRGADFKLAYFDCLLDLENANLEGAILFGCSMDGSNLSGANLKGADIASVTLNESMMIGTDFSNADIHGSYLIDCRMDRCDLSNSNLRDANLRKSYLTGANLTGADVRNASLIDIDLDGANLIYCYDIVSFTGGTHLAFYQISTGYLRVDWIGNNENAHIDSIVRRNIEWWEGKLREDNYTESGVRIYISWIKMIHELFEVTNEIL